VKMFFFFMLGRSELSWLFYVFISDVSSWTLTMEDYPYCIGPRAAPIQISSLCFHDNGGIIRAVKMITKRSVGHEVIHNDHVRLLVAVTDHGC
jgi:hypothetical protein